jgi:penicillin-binding protein 1A
MKSTTTHPSTPGGVPNRPASSQTPSAAKKGRRYPHSFWWYLKWFFISIQLIIFCLIIVTICVGKGLYDQLNKIVPDTRFITARNKAEPTRIYASDGTMLAEFKGEQRNWISIETLKVQRKRYGKTVTEAGPLINATLSIEDARFYTHPGMDAYRIAGAAVANFKNADGVSQGGSTITEQLAVNIYLTRTKTLARRLQTALLALQLEKRFSKDEILELYLNEIYYGNRAYGAEAASHVYFRRNAKNLTIAQAAFLSGLPQQPSRLDPFDAKGFERAKKRQRLVLKAMLENKKINWGQYQQAIRDTSLQTLVESSKAKFLAERNNVDKWKAPYFVAYVKQYLQKQYHWSDEFLNKSGLKIYTTLDPKIQQVAESVMNKRLDRIGQSQLQGALVCIDPWSGHVLAMYGGRDYYDKKSGQFNRATQARRQPGSTFKPFVYATAMEMGYSPDSIVRDKPTKVNGKQIKNFEGAGVHFGNITFKRALGKSNNVAATRILMRVGVQNVVQKAHMMGIQSPLAPYPSLALGASEITLLESTSAYGNFATRGLHAETTPVDRVQNYAGEVLMEHAHPVHAPRVLSEEAGNRMWEMLRYVVTNGTGGNAQINGVDVIGKTGTTSSNKDVWFMGATRKLVTGVWMGYDKPRELYGSTGGGWCAPAWRSFTLQALDIWNSRNPVDKLVEDARATQLQRLRAKQFKRTLRVTVCNESGLLATRSCTRTRVIEFSASGGAPERYCDLHGQMTTPRTLDQSGSDDSTRPGDLGYGENSEVDPARRDSGVSSESESTLEVPMDAGSSEGGEPVEEAPVRQGARPSTERVARRSRAEEVSYSVEGGAPAADGEVVATICAESGQIGSSKCPVTLQQFFLASDVPRRRCTQH